MAGLRFVLLVSIPLKRITTKFGPSKRGALRNLSVEKRRDFLAQHGLDADAIEQYLNGARCGGLGEAAPRFCDTK